MDSKPHKISGITATIMICVALLFDLISVIPFVNIITTFLSGLVFTIWFWLLGLGVVNSRRISTMVIVALGEFVPIVGALPFITIGVVVIIIMNNIPITARLTGTVVGKTKTHTTPIKQPKQTPSPPSTQATGVEREQKNKKPKSSSADISKQIIEPETKQANIVTFPRRTITDINPPVPFTEEDSDLAI